MIYKDRVSFTTLLGVLDDNRNKVVGNLVADEVVRTITASVAVGRNIAYSPVSMMDFSGWKHRNVPSPVIPENWPVCLYSLRPMAPWLALSDS